MIRNLATLIAAPAVGVALFTAPVLAHPSDGIIVVADCAAPAGVIVTIEPDSRSTTYKIYLDGALVLSDVPGEIEGDYASYRLAATNGAHVVRVTESDGSAAGQLESHEVTVSCTGNDASSAIPDTGASSVLLASIAAGLVGLGAAVLGLRRRFSHA